MLVVTDTGGTCMKVIGTGHVGYASIQSGMTYLSPAEHGRVAIDTGRVPGIGSWAD